MGARPESLTYQAKEGAGEDCLSARVELVEPMGNETFLYADTGRHKIVARVDSHIAPTQGQVAHFAPVPQKTHYFDGATGAAII
jgi:multiple sugar transport system ATP-binding protein